MSNEEIIVYVVTSTAGRIVFDALAEAEDFHETDGHGPIIERLMTRAAFDALPDVD